ncbi:zinc finger protein [Loa loa]|nr:zinc finger protein [Loa loa]EFO24408.2 zinc finger protein [Loa loa]
MMNCPEVITLDNSDDDDSNGHNSVSRHVGATASVIRAKPLRFSTLQPRRSTTSKLPLPTTASPSTQFHRINISETPATPMLQKAFSSLLHTKLPVLELQNRVISDTENDTSYITLSSSRRENNLDSYCYESYDPRAPPFEAQQFSAKFRCSVGNCRMLLSNNVSFMFHLWAHLTEFSYGSSLNCPREMHRFCRCPQCLHLFPTAYRLQIHYDNVHSATPSSSTCKICEITVDESKHRKIHGDFDAPFHCRKCRYRTSMRTHFIDHFVRFHSNTRTLLCPFCLNCYVIPRDNTSSMISEREYVRHFLLHQEENYGCDQCSLKFIRHADKIAHRREHTQPNLKWISKNIQVHTRRKGRKLWSKKKKWKCTECNEGLSNVCEHFKRMYHCPHCGYRTNCHTASQRHKFIKCTTKRGGMTRAQLLPSLIVCNRCKRASCIERDILNHVRACSEGRCVVVNLKQEKSNILSQYNDELEMKIFALRPYEETARLGNGDVVSDVHNFCRLRDQNSLSPSLVKANMELNNARLHILKRICPRPRFSFADMLKCS